MTETNEWITIREQPCVKGHKTKRFAVRTKDSDCFLLGIIKWDGPWRKYCFYPAEMKKFEWDCMRNIADFCQQQTKEHKKDWIK